MGRYGQSASAKQVAPPAAPAGPKAVPVRPSNSAAKSPVPSAGAAAARKTPLPAKPAGAKPVSQSRPPQLPEAVLGGPGGSASRGEASTANGRRGAVGRLEAAQIAAQLGIMIEAGVPLSQALDSLQTQSDQANIRNALQAILAEVRNGSDLSAAIARCPYRFPAVFSRLLRAAEASGAMGSMLQRIADYLQSEVETIRKLRGALAYPAIMLALAVGAIGLIFGFLLPRFEKMYAARQSLLPMPTKIALAISHGLRAHSILLAVAAAVFILGIVLFVRSARGRIAMDWLKLHIPLLNRMFRQFYVARSFQTMGTMIAAGVTVPEAVRLSRDVAGNCYFAHLWDVADAHLQAGQRLADPLFASDLVSNTVAQMVATGERSGNLAGVMERVAALCEMELQHTIKTVTGMIEPLMIIVLGGVVGSVVMAILLPVFRMAKLMGS